MKGNNYSVLPFRNGTPTKTGAKTQVAGGKRTHTQRKGGEESEGMPRRRSCAEVFKQKKNKKISHSALGG